MVERSLKPVLAVAAFAALVLWLIPPAPGWRTLMTFALLAIALLYLLKR